jgi:hypothetical protein
MPRRRNAARPAPKRDYTFGDLFAADKVCESGSSLCGEAQPAASPVQGTDEALTTSGHRRKGAAEGPGAVRNSAPTCESAQVRERGDTVSQRAGLLSPLVRGLIVPARG